MEAKAHWQQVYEQRAPDEVSWFEPLPERSLALIEEAGIDPGAPLIDVGGGESHLAAELLSRTYTDVTVADISPAALKEAQRELQDQAERIDWVIADVGAHDFGRQFDLWHDRAVFHFMVEQADRDAYLRTLRDSLRPGGHLIMATFGPQGPTQCSGLPVHRYGETELMELLGNEFALVSSQLDMHHTPSGIAQQFLFVHAQRTEAQ